MSALTPESPIAAKVFPSPNHGERKGGRRPTMLVLHYTGMPDEGEALQWLCNPVSQVSAHYFVFGDGRVLQMVPETRRAWHAGRSSWDGETDINSCSIGIEIANPGHPGGLPPFPDAQIESVAALAKDIVTRWGISPHHVLAHSDVAPGRKLDPGEAFPWQRLHEAGVGHWVAPSPVRDGRCGGAAGHAGHVRLSNAHQRRIRRGHREGGSGLSASLQAGAGGWRCRCVDHHYPERLDRATSASCRMTKS